MGSPLGSDIVERAIAGKPDAVRALIHALTPIIHVRVARALQRSATVRAQGRSPQQDVEDLTQEVFLALFDDDARALRAWNPARGASITTFVSLITEHQVASILRSGRRRPWRNEDAGDDALEHVAAERTGAEARVASRQVYAQLLERVRAEVSPRGLELFYALIVDEESVESVGARTGMTADAIYAWRSRLARLVRKIAADLDREGNVSDSNDPERRAPGVVP